MDRLLSPDTMGMNGVILGPPRKLDLGTHNDLGITPGITMNNYSSSMRLLGSMITILRSGAINENVCDRKLVWSFRVISTRPCLQADLKEFTPYAALGSSITSLTT